jgi:hypothetical protein
VTQANAGPSGAIDPNHETIWDPISTRDQD